MSREELPNFSYVVLTLVGRYGAGPHDLVRMSRRGQRLYYAGAQSKMYEQPKRLEQLGYLTSEKTPGKTRERTHYRLTEKGLEALREWIAQPTSFPRIQNDAITKVLASDLAEDPSAVVESLRSLRAEIRELHEILDEAERQDVALPHRKRQLKLIRSYGRRMLQAHLDWIDEIERELGGATCPARRRSRTDSAA